jgi:hypothetical protein
MRRLGCLLGLLIGGILLIPRRGRTSPPPSRPFPLNGRTHKWAWDDALSDASTRAALDRGLADVKAGRIHIEGRHTDGSCAFCDYIDAHRRVGNL